MKHVMAFLFSAVCFGIASFLMVTQRAHLASSLPLLLTIVGFYVASLACAFPAQMDVARTQAVAWYTAWKGQ